MLQPGLYCSVRIYRREHFASGNAWNKNRSKDGVKAIYLQ